MDAEHEIYRVHSGPDPINDVKKKWLHMLRAC